MHPKSEKAGLISYQLMVAYSTAFPKDLPFRNKNKISRLSILEPTRMPAKRQRAGDAHTSQPPHDPDMEDESEPPRKFPSLPGEFIQYPTQDSDPHPGIGKEEEMARNAIALLNPTRRTSLHPVTGSLVFLCYIIPGLHAALHIGVPLTSYLAQPQHDASGNLRHTVDKFYGRDYSRTMPSQLEVSSILSHCCTLLIGVVIGSSEKVRAEVSQIKKRFKTLMVTLGRWAHGDTANLLQTYNPATAVDWINAQPWVGSLILGLISTEFQSPGKEFMEQIKLVAGYAQLTTYTTIKEYLSQCMDATITIIDVAREIDDFLDTEERLKHKHGGFFKYLGAMRHPDAILLAPRSFPNLTSAALFWSRRETPTMTGFKAPVIQPSATIKDYPSFASTSTYTYFLQKSSQGTRIPSAQIHNTTPGLPDKLGEE